MSNRTCKASVFVEDGTTGAWLVAETPSEVEALLAAPPSASGMISLTLANDDSSWNGRPIYVRRTAVRSISPPMDQDDDD